MRHLPRRERSSFVAVLPLALLAACAGEMADPGEQESSVARGAEVTGALQHDGSPPLTLLPVAPSSGALVEHEVKKIPRRFNTSAPSDTVVQNLAPALLMPASSWFR